jgi:hypothetical protein
MSQDRNGSHVIRNEIIGSNLESECVGIGSSVALDWNYRTLSSPALDLQPKQAFPKRVLE